MVGALIATQPDELTVLATPAGLATYCGCAAGAALASLAALETVAAIPSITAVATVQKRNAGPAVSSVAAWTPCRAVLAGLAGKPVSAVRTRLLRFTGN